MVIIELIVIITLCILSFIVYTHHNPYRNNQPYRRDEAMMNHHFYRTHEPPRLSRRDSDYCGDTTTRKAVTDGRVSRQKRKDNVQVSEFSPAVFTFGKTNQTRDKDDYKRMENPYISHQNGNGSGEGHYSDVEHISRKTNERMGNLGSANSRRQRNEPESGIWSKLLARL